MVKQWNMDDTLAGGLDIRGAEATGLIVDYVWNVGTALADWLPVA